MSVHLAWTTVLTMPPALTLRGVMSVLVTLDSLEMDSTAQVRLHNSCAIALHYTYVLV